MGFEVQVVLGWSMERRLETKLMAGPLLLAARMSLV